MKKCLALLVSAALALAACTAAPPNTPELPGGSAVSKTSAHPIEQAKPAPASRPNPETGWKLEPPERHRMEPTVFTQMHEKLRESEVFAMVTAKDGVIIDEYYQQGYDETSVFALHSCSKSVTGALIGIAIAQGLIGGVDDKLAEYLPQVLEQEDPRKHELTLRQLLTHTSGLEWYEWGGGKSNWQEFQTAPNWVEYILGRDIVAQPGAVFNYSTGNTHLLSAALERAAGMSQMDYARERLFAPLGMDSVVWRTDPQGVIDGGNGISMTARDAARFGQLYLEGGLWNGEQIIPEDWLRQSTTKQNEGPGGSTGQYGYQWWIRSFGDKGVETFYAFGAWGQYIFVVPELDLVTVIASRYPQDSYAPRPFFTDYVLAAYTG